MKRDIDIKDISDGKLYTANDMVKTDCHDCIGCSDCCRGMGSSILLDPMDIWRLTSNLQTDFNSLLDKYVELGMVDGLIMPNLKDIKSRIGSVQNTKKITKAMKMVAAAKVKKAENTVKAARPFSDELLFLFRKETQPLKLTDKTQVNDYVPTFLMGGVIVLLISASFIKALTTIAVNSSLVILRLGSKVVSEVPFTTPIALSAV